MSLQADHTSPAFLEGVRLFNQRQFFEAHEAWEIAWRESTGVEKQFYQGLIQCAVALEHRRRGNAVGARRMLERAAKRFAGVPEQFMGIRVSDLLDAVRSSVREGNSDESDSSCPTIALS